jgi:hypothetical protein
MKSNCKRPSAQAIRTLFADAVHLSAAIGERLHCGRDTRQAFAKLDLVLQCLPLTQAEFGTLNCRLNNAASYVAREERHAAGWEIGQLNRRLQALNWRWHCCDSPEPHFLNQRRLRSC